MEDIPVDQQIFMLLTKAKIGGRHHHPHRTRKTFRVVFGRLSRTQRQLWTHTMPTRLLDQVSGRSGEAGSV
jgi:hypothetical protein